MKGWVAGLLLAAAALPANAVPFSFSHEFSGSGFSCANGACATLSVVQHGSNVDFLLTASLAPGEFVTGLYGNRDPFVAHTAAEFASRAGTGANAALPLTSGLNGYKADGDGFFDYVWDFETANSGPRLDGTDTFSWTFFNTSLDDVVDAMSVNGPSGKTGFTFALKVQGLGNQGSGWFNSTITQQVSEPATAALLALALLAMGFVRRRKTALA
jgi:hypothetical protein